MSVGDFEPCSKFNLLNEYERKQIKKYLFKEHHVADDIDKSVDYILKNIVNETKLNELIKRCKYFNKREIELDEKIEKINEKMKNEKDIKNVLRMEKDIESLLKKKKEKYKYLTGKVQMKFINNVILLNMKETLTKEELNHVYIYLFSYLKEDRINI